MNAETSYNFYVIKDTGEELTLIMDRNLGNKVAWYSTTDNSQGPLTALTALEERTSGWTNVSTMSYTLSDDNSTPKYQSITRTNVRARMLTKTEASELGCTELNGSCPSYLHAYTSSSNTVEQPVGYLLSTAHSDSSNFVWIVYFESSFSRTPVFDISGCGVRPIITISKIS